MANDGGLFRPAAPIPILPPAEVQRRHPRLRWHIGVFGYLGRTVQSKALGTIAEKYGWDVAFDWILGAALGGIAILAVTGKLSPRSEGARGRP